MRQNEYTYLQVLTQIVSIFKERDFSKSGVLLALKAAEKKSRQKIMYHCSKSPQIYFFVAPFI